MLPRQVCLGDYGDMFGTPDIGLRIVDDRIRSIAVERGAPCGATWEAARRVEGISVAEALTRFGLEVQFFCTADGAAWDPIYSKSPVHMAADIHTAALKRALKTLRQKM